MSSMFDNLGVGESQGLGALINTSAADTPEGRERARKKKEMEDATAENERRSNDTKNYKGKPGRKGTILTKPEETGAGISTPVQNNSTPYPFVTG